MRVVELFSAFLLLLLLLLATPSHAQSSNPFMTDDDPDSADDTPSTSTEISSTTTDSTDSSTEISSTTTDSTDSSTEISSTTTDSTASSTETSSTTADSTTSPSEDTSSPPTSTTTTPPPDLNLFEDTRQELDKITTTLNEFSSLVNSNSTSSPAASASARGHRGHPVGWWKLGTETRPLQENNFCVSNDTINNETCVDLYNELNTIDVLVVTLKDNVDGWRKSNLIDLTTARLDLQKTYDNASRDADAFRASVKTDTFNSRIKSVEEDVEAASAVVVVKIDELTIQDSGPVILVAVIGTIGGLMMVAIISVMVYGAVMRVKTKKKLSSAVKIQGEDIPDDGFVSDGPGSRQNSRTDPYSRPVGFSVQSDPYAAPYGRRSESNYRSPVVPTPRQGLPRTQF